MQNFSIRNITQIISLLNQINLINQFGSVSDMEIWKVCNQIITKNKHKFNPLSGNPTKWSNTQIIEPLAVVDELFDCV